ncbi:cytochrome P450 [Lojkania enalia]|uniref:Cytochrome P450 n=1 Tax=Lojkania enalia TaxID=147567 RepID=A0A9P4K4D8_9PLEO|nr:cytochrome P450 [Didymosphaeria enalia]
MLFALSPIALVWAGLVFFTLLTLLHKLYTALTNPLRKFPGPWLCHYSNVPYSYWLLRRRKEFWIHSMHEKYGPVVCVAPNEISFNTAQSWKDIYGFRHGHQTFIKSEFYDGYMFIEEGIHGIITSRDPKEHASMRRFMSHAFSSLALKEQEPLVEDIIEHLVANVREIGVKKGEVMEFDWWLRLCMFDIMGSLAFGKSFDALKNGGQHPSVKFIHEATRQVGIIDIMKRFPIAGKIYALFFARTLLRLLEGNKKHEQFALKIAQERLANPSKRPDFLTRLQENMDESQGAIHIAAQAAELLQAGTDTTNITIKTALNYILRDKALYNRLKNEIRTRFPTYKSINAQDAVSLPFLRTVILEAMRIYAPVAPGLPRLVPRGGDTVDGIFVPEGTVVSTNAFSANLSSRNWEDPMTFKPDRWAKDRVSKSWDILEAAQPFSLGPRGCIGQNLAWVEMNFIICKLMWSFDFELVNADMDLHRDSFIDTLWNGAPLYLRVRVQTDINGEYGI